MQSGCLAQRFGGYHVVLYRSSQSVRPPECNYVPTRESKIVVSPQTCDFITHRFSDCGGGAAVMGLAPFENL